MYNTSLFPWKHREKIVCIAPLEGEKRGNKYSARIAGAVTDVGGPMCHAAIVCREYGLPTVVGTGKGTQLIKTGDLIRMDGDSGLVTILERAT